MAQHYEFNQIKKAADAYLINNYNEILYKGIAGYIFRYQHKILSPKYLLNKKIVLGF